MEQEPQQQPPVMQQEAPVSPEPEKSGGMGPLIGIVIIIIVLIFGGLYFWGAQLNSQLESSDDDTAILEDIAPTDDNTIAPPSDEPEQLESDLEEFDTDDFEAELEAELNALEAEL